MRPGRVWLKTDAGLAHRDAAVLLPLRHESREQVLLREAVEHAPELQHLEKHRQVKIPVRRARSG